MYSLDNKYTIISQSSFWYNSLYSKEFKVLVSGKIMQWAFFVCVHSWLRTDSCFGNQSTKPKDDRVDILKKIKKCN